MTQFPETITGLYFGVFAEDFARYVIGAGGVHLGINLLFGPMLAHRRVRDEPRPGWTQIGGEITASLRTTLVFALFGTLIALGAIHGVLPVYLDIGQYGLIWLPLSLMLLIIGHDAWFYWSHRLMHGRRLFRRLHRLHHLSRNPTAFTAYSFNLGEAIAHAAYLPVVLVVVPAHPLVIFLFTTHMMLRNAIGHCGTEIFPAGSGGKPLFGWMTTVTHHDLHHENGRWNLGLYFTWWDRICGTEHPDYLARFRASIGRAALPVLLLVAGLLPPAGAAAAETLTGSWATRDLSAVIHFSPCTDDISLTCARLTHLRVSRTPRPARIGDDVMRGRIADTGPRGGHVSDPVTGHSSIERIRVIDAGKLAIRTCSGALCTDRMWYSTRWMQSARGLTAPLP